MAFGLENPLNALIGLALGIVLILLSRLTLQRLRVAERSLEIVKWKTARRLVRAVNFGSKGALTLAVTLLLATPYLTSATKVPLDLATDEQLSEIPSTFMILQDVSQSMNVTDLQPSRFEAARIAIELLLDKVGVNDLVGYLAFAGEVYGVQQPTLDREAVEEVMEGQTLHSATAMGTAIQTATGMLDPYQSGKAIILLSDGKNNFGVDPEEAAAAALDRNVTIFSIFFGAYGIGTSDPVLLRNISETTGGQMYTVSTEDLDSLTLQASKVAQEAKVEALRRIQTDLTVEVKDYDTPNLVLIVMLLAAIFLMWFTGI